MDTYKIAAIASTSAMVLWGAGCIDSIQANSPDEKAAVEMVKIVLECETVEELIGLLKDQSLGGETAVQTQNRFTFLQTFPYSGVRASYLYVYIQNKGPLRFLGYFRVPTQDKVRLKSIKDGSVEIIVDNKRIASIGADSEE